MFGSRDRWKNVGYTVTYRYRGRRSETWRKTSTQSDPNIKKKKKNDTEKEV